LLLLRGNWVRSFNQKEEVLTAFLDKLADVEIKNDVAIIIHGADKSEILSELGRLTVTLKLSFDAGSLAPYVYTSQEIQGLSRPHVFVAIDIQNALVASGDIGVLKTAFQALYVAESREEESLTIWLPGNHASVKNVSKNAIFSYPKVDIADKKENGTPTEKVLQWQKENLNLVDLIKRISRSEEIDPEKNKPNEQIEGIENKGIEESEEAEKAKKTPPKIKKTVKTEKQKDASQDQHEKNVNADPWEELHKDPSKFFKEAAEKYPTMEDALKALEEDQFGACNL